MTTAKALVAALGALFASAASAQAQAPAAFTAISPVFGQLVAFSMPSGFVVVSENANGLNYIREAVLRGETVDRWTQMITVTGVKGLAGNPKVSPESFAGSIAGGFKAACPDSFTAKGFCPGVASVPCATAEAGAAFNSVTVRSGARGLAMRTSSLRARIRGPFTIRRFSLHVTEHRARS